MEVRQSIRACDLQPGCFLWLPESTNETQNNENDQALPPAAYNHPIVFLSTTDIADGITNCDTTVSVALVTSFGARTLRAARNKARWDSYLAIHPSTHPSNESILFLETGKLQKSSYVKLKRITIQLSALRTYTKGLSAKASDLCLRTDSWKLLLRRLGMGEELTFQERRLAITRETPTSPLPLFSSPPATPSALVAQNNMPCHTQTLASETTPLVTRTQRSCQHISVSPSGNLTSNARSNYGTSYGSSLPPPVTWDYVRTSETFSNPNRVAWGLVFRFLIGILSVLLLFCIIIGIGYAIWIFVSWAFIEIEHCLNSIWVSLKELIGHGWTSFVKILADGWHNFIAWLKSLIEK